MLVNKFPALPVFQWAAKAGVLQALVWMVAECPGSSRVCHVYKVRVDGAEKVEHATLNLFWLIFRVIHKICLPSTRDEY